MKETMDSSQKDAAILERGTDPTRGDRDRPLSASEGKSSPNNLFDQAMSFFRAHGAEMAEDIGRFAKRESLAVALTALGVACMLVARKSAGDFQRDGYVSGRDDQEDASEEYAGNRSSKKAGDESTESDLTTSGAANERVSAVAYRDVNRPPSQSERLTRGLRVIAHEQPLLLAALGIALGAAIGAALAESDATHRWLGSARNGQ